MFNPLSDKYYDITVQIIIRNFSLKKSRKKIIIFSEIVIRIFFNYFFFNLFIFLNRFFFILANCWGTTFELRDWLLIIMSQVFYKNILVVVSTVNFDQNYNVKSIFSSYEIFETWNLRAMKYASHKFSTHEIFDPWNFRPMEFSTHEIFDQGNFRPMKFSTQENYWLSNLDRNFVSKFWLKFRPNFWAEFATKKFESIFNHHKIFEGIFNHPLLT